MKKYICAVSSMVLCFVMSVAVHAEGPGTTAGILLKHNSSPRAEAMGGAHTAVADTESGAAYWNPAGLYNNYYQAVNAMFYHGIVDDAIGSINYSQTLWDNFSMGGGLLYYDAGKFDLTTMAGESTQVNAEQDILAIGTLAGKINVFDREFLVGANIKFLYSCLLESETATGIALDLGAMYRADEILENLTLGLAVKNIGPPIVYIEEPNMLPLDIAAGAAYKWRINDQHRLLLAADADWGWDSDVRGNMGVEYWFENMVALRTGYKLGYDLDGFTIGAGFRYMNFQLDYVFGLMSALNSTHKISLGYTLSVDEARKKDVLKKYVAPTPKPTATPTPKPQATPTPVPPMLAEILEVQPDHLILSIGKNKHIRKGYRGRILTESDVVIGKFVVVEVYPRLCRVKITEKIKGIDQKNKVEIDRR